MEACVDDVVTTAARRVGILDMMSAMAALARNEEGMLSGLAVVREAPCTWARFGSSCVDPRSTRGTTLVEGELDVQTGLVGDTWAERAAHPRRMARRAIAQVTLMNAATPRDRCARDRWSEAGDQLYVDLDLSIENLPAGSLLSVGTAVLDG